MTKDTKKFIHPNLFLEITETPVFSDMFDSSVFTMPHIYQAKWADLFLIYPATASTIGKIASGICDNLLTTICTETKAKIILAPSMNKTMWEDSIIQQNILKLRDAGYHFINPTKGEQACGDFGYGRMQEPEKIIEHVLYSPLKELKALVTAGPTIDKIDPVRYIRNNSSGKMGYAMAGALNDLGAEVILVSGPTHIPKPHVERVINVVSAEEMHDAVLQEIDVCEIFVSVGSVADYKASSIAKSKIKKNRKSKCYCIPSKWNLRWFILYNRAGELDVDFR